MRAFLQLLYIGLHKGAMRRAAEYRKAKETEVSEKQMFMYAGDYESVDDAKADLEVLKELHRDKFVGTYDAAVLTKTDEGKVEIVEQTEKPTQHGGWAGLAAGAAIG